MAMPAMHSGRLLGVSVYVSDGRTAEILNNLKDLCRSRKGVLLATSFVDNHYNRSSFTLIGTEVEQLSTAAADITRKALASIDLSGHAATHPRLGVVDHVSCHPLGPKSRPPDAAELAVCIASTLSQGELAVPVYLYGDAHPTRRDLATIRRNLGYFQPQQEASWVGKLPLSSLLPYPPDMGPLQAAASRGVLAVGATPWVVNYNVPLMTSDLGIARIVARRLSERGGGLPKVQAMALRHGEVVEVACNLLDSDLSPPERVAAEVARLARDMGVEPGEGYRIGKAQEDLLQMAEQNLPC